MSISLRKLASLGARSGTQAEPQEKVRLYMFMSGSGGGGGSSAAGGRSGGGDSAGDEPGAAAAPGAAAEGQVLQGADTSEAGAGEAAQNEALAKVVADATAAAAGEEGPAPLDDREGIAGGGGGAAGVRTRAASKKHRGRLPPLHLGSGAVGSGGDGGDGGGAETQGRITRSAVRPAELPRTSLGQSPE
jgi:hypothetical protein